MSCDNLIGPHYCVVPHGLYTVRHLLLFPPPTTAAGSVVVKEERPDGEETMETVA